MVTARLDEFATFGQVVDEFGPRGLNYRKLSRLAESGRLPLYTDATDRRRKLVKLADVERLMEPQLATGH